MAKARLSEIQIIVLNDLARRVDAARPWDDQVRTYDALCRKGLAEWTTTTPERSGGYYATDAGRQYIKDET